MADPRRGRYPNNLVDAEDSDSSTCSACSFVFSKQRQTVPNDIDMLQDKSEEVNERDAQAESGKDALQNGIILQVLRSTYTGDTVLGGPHEAEITTMEEHSKSARAGSGSIFRWVHFEDPSMSLNQFGDAIRAIPNLTSAARSSLAKVCKQLEQKDQLYKFPGDVSARYLIPCIVEQSISDTSILMDDTEEKATFICMPYFSLEAYRKVKPSTSTSSHPIRTLLQSGNLTTGGMVRDLNQAVCLLNSEPNVPAGHCYHVDQLWTLTIASSLLVTYSRQSLRRLLRDQTSVSFTTSPSPLPSILVSHGSQVLSFEFDECRTWFTFLSHCWQAWPTVFRFKLHGRDINRDNWDATIKDTQNRTLKLTMQRSFRGSPSFPRATLKQTRGAQSAADRSSFGIHSMLSVPNVCLLPWYLGEPFPKEFCATGTREELIVCLQEVEQYLQQETKDKVRLAYRRCQVSSFNKIRQSLVKQSDAASQLDEDAEADVAYDERLKVFSYAAIILELFVPLHYTGPTVDKYWGAVESILGTMSSNQAAGDLISQNESHQGMKEGEMLREEMQKAKYPLAWLRRCANMALAFQETFNEANTMEMSQLRRPGNVAKIWIHTILSLVSFAARDMKGFEKQRDLVTDMLSNFRDQFGIVFMSKRSCSGENLVFSPEGLQALITLHLIKKKTLDDADIEAVYHQSLTELHTAVTGDPVNRDHQEKLVWLQQEVLAIADTIEAQRDILIGMIRNSTMNGNLYNHPARRRDRTLRLENAVDDARDPNTSRVLGKGDDTEGPRGVILRDSLSFLEARLRSFAEDFLPEVVYLENWNLRRIETNKDRQEASIYAFTIVTIIFLPVSTIAGILGMNTNDIRNMQSDQWLFWVLAIPFTVITTGVCFIGTGELRRLLYRMQEPFNVGTANTLGTIALLLNVFDCLLRRKRSETNNESRSREPPIAERLPAVGGSERLPSSPEDFIQPVPPFVGIQRRPSTYPIEPLMSFSGKPPRGGIVARCERR